MIFARVSASSVLPQPVGPTSSTFDFWSSTSPAAMDAGDALVVVVDGDAEDLLGVVLTDDVLVERAQMTWGLGLSPLLVRFGAVLRLSSWRTSLERSMH